MERVKEKMTGGLVEAREGGSGHYAGSEMGCKNRWNLPMHIFGYYEANFGCCLNALGNCGRVEIICPPMGMAYISRGTVLALTAEIGSTVEHSVDSTIMFSCDVCCYYFTFFCIRYIEMHTMYTISILRLKFIFSLYSSVIIEVYIHAP